MWFVLNDCEDHNALGLRFIAPVFDKGATNPQQRAPIPMKDKNQTKKRLVDTYLHDETLYFIVATSLPLSSPFFFSLRQGNTLEALKMS